MKQLHYKAGDWVRITLRSLAPWLHGRQAAIVDSHPEQDYDYTIKLVDGSRYRVLEEEVTLICHTPFYPFYPKEVESV